MVVYKATKKEFLEDFRKETVIPKIEEGYKKEVAKKIEYKMINSWNGSIPYLYLLLEDDSIPNDCGISIEHEIPNIDRKKRIDVVITGKSKNNENVAIIIELKQWSEVKQPADKAGYVMMSDSQNKAPRVHPSFQGYSYSYYLKNYNQAFAENNIQTYSCAFLHNYTLKQKDILFDERYKICIDKCPIFLRGDLEKLRKFIKDKIEKGDNGEVIDMIEKSQASIVKKLTPSVVDIMKETQYITLIDEQEIVYEKALEMAKKSMQDNKKRVLIVKGRTRNRKIGISHENASRHIYEP